jgi:hypothetical protein
MQTTVVHSHASGSGQTIHMGLVACHTVCTLAALVMSIVITVYTLGGSCSVESCQPMLFITSTFMSSRRVESNVGWPVATERTSFDPPNKQSALEDGTSYIGYAFSHFYECMHSARMADTTCNFPDSFNDYYKCMTNSTPSPIRTALSACNIFPTVSNYSHYMTSEDYITCLNWQPVLRNSISQRASRNVFRACLAKSQWPIVEYQLDVDTPVTLGSYHWGLFLTVGLAIMTSFSVYSASWKEDGHVIHGEPGYFMRLGFFWTAIAWAWNLAFLIICILVAFRDSGNFESNGGLPTTVSTTLFTLGVLGFVLVYFGNELFAPGNWEFIAHALEGTGIHKIEKHHDRGYHRLWGNERLASSSHANGELGLSMPGASREYVISPAEVAKYYTPPLLATWADGYIADPLIFLGVAGATQQITTDQAWNLLVLVGGYRLLNMMIARFMYECFMNNFSLSDSVNQRKFGIRPFFLQSGEGSEKDPHLSTRVMALSTQISAIYLFIAVLYLSFNGSALISDFPIFQFFVVFCFMIPEAIRTALHIFCQIWNIGGKSSSWLILNVHMFVWNWDVALRLVFISLIILQSNGDWLATRQYLVNQTNTLLRDFLNNMF